MAKSLVRDYQRVAVLAVVPSNLPTFLDHFSYSTHNFNLRRPYVPPMPNHGSFVEDGFKNLHVNADAESPPTFAVVAVFPAHR